MTIKLQKWGNSYAVRIPKSFIDDLNLSQGLEMEVKHDNQSLIIKQKKQKEYTLKELLKGITPKNRHKLVFDGHDVGNEKSIW